MVDTTSIFITKDELNDISNISGKITYTNILDTIPDGSMDKPLKDWKSRYNTEWRWRFLKLPKDRLIVEISYQSNKNEERMYFNCNGKWVIRTIDPIYDNFVIKEHYYYSDK